jgi:hypothetical protein
MSLAKARSFYEQNKNIYWSDFQGVQLQIADHYFAKFPPGKFIYKTERAKRNYTSEKKRYERLLTDGYYFTRKGRLDEGVAHLQKAESLMQEILLDERNEGLTNVIANAVNEHTHENLLVIATVGEYHARGISQELASRGIVVDTVISDLAADADLLHKTDEHSSLLRAKGNGTSLEWMQAAIADTLYKWPYTWEPYPKEATNRDVVDAMVQMYLATPEAISRFQESVSKIGWRRTIADYYAAYTRDSGNRR